MAQTRYQGEVLRVWEARALLEHSNKQVGSVIHADKQGIDVTCGEGVLRLLRLQRPGGKPQDITSFLNANAVEGVVLGG